MKTEEYIASGILELYASGGLSAEERMEVAAMAQKYPEIRNELYRIEETLEKYALLHATPPPAALKNKILTAISQTSQGQNLAPETAVINDLQPVIPISRPVNEERSNGKGFSWLMAAAVMLLLLSAGLNYFLYRNWQNAEGNLQLALNQQQEIARNFEQARFQLNKSETTLYLLQDQDTKRILLQGLARSPESQAIVHWHPHRKTVLLQVKKLPAAPAGKQYQLWALRNGKPINAGLFSPTDTVMGMQEMKPIAAAEAFALTLEPTGGSENPTMEEMFMLGKM